MIKLIKEIKEHSKFKRLAAILAGKDAAQATGLWGTSSRYLAAALLGEVSQRIIFVTSRLDEAESAYDEISFLAGGSVSFFPPWDDYPEGEEPLNPEIAHSRLSTIQKLLGAENPMEGIVVTPITALMQPVPSRKKLESGILELGKGRHTPQKEVIEFLADAGFERVYEVELPGQFSVRGGMVDVFSQAADEPFRIEFFGDTVESIRTFSITDQLSERKLEHCKVLALERKDILALQGARKAQSLLSFAGQDSIIVFNETGDIEKSAEEFKRLSLHGESLISYAGIFLESRNFRRLFLSTFEEGLRCPAVHFDVRLLPSFKRDAGEAFAELARLREDCRRMILVCTNEGEKKRLEEMLQQHRPDLRRRADLITGPLRAGFNFADIEMVIVSYDDIFQRYYQRRPARKFIPARPIDSFLELSRGDYVVHSSHGIGRYLGLKVLERDGQKDEFLVIEFAEKTKVYVPASMLRLVQKYVGGKEAPELDKIGGASWTRRKAAVTRAVMDLASDLISIQAERALHRGIAFPPDESWQNEFEASFIFQETEDQLKANEEVKADMETSEPMDRLLCGDVGYGKTEIAVRAAFKAALAGYQTAVLVPTTVLAQQHYRTFTERVADYPVIVDVLSRFKTASEQKKTIEALARGEIDVIIGTHRLIQKDVVFKNIGLLIIDEEQRFGVIHKEYIKQMKKTVDVLTLTATPIPRTLHMALLGIRDISSLETPPRDRLSIHTEVRKFDEGLIREAILRELNRNGQVYYVHNRVYNIKEVADDLERIVPEARIDIIHGQMSEHKMEDVMLEFVAGDIDVLVATTIIESGLDIPNVNTLIIDEADMFGLADLHQLRGRVGRYKHRAYAYLLLPRNRPMTALGRKRLKAIQDFSELGSGYRIAMRDLEIRGAGNILGRQQSGHIAAVGYEMYCQILENATRFKKGQPLAEPAAAHLKLNVKAYIPESYIQGERQKLEMYRKLSRVTSLQQLKDIEGELKDRYGRPPREVKNLIEKSRLSLMARDYRLASIFTQDNVLVITGKDPVLLKKALRRVKTDVRFIDELTVHVVLPGRALSDTDLLRFIKMCLKS